MGPRQCNSASEYPDNNRNEVYLDMKILGRNRILIIVAAVLLLVLVVILWRTNAAHDGATTKIQIHGLKTSAAIKPALTVTATSPSLAEWPEKTSANGNITAWQEASIGSEVNGLRLTEVKANVGDTVHRGQVLAVFSSETVKADVAQALASVAEAEARLAEAKANADRARQISSPGVLSAQQVGEYLAAERAASARLDSARAQLSNQQIRLKQTYLTAEDEGIISARTATVGAVVSVGQELFRLIRFSRLEWRAEVAAADLHKILTGQTVRIAISGGIQVKGSVRMEAPIVDPQTRMGLVYVDLPSNKGLKAGMFAHGDFELGRKTVMTLPQTAIVQYEGFNYVYRIGADSKVSQVKVEIGRRLEQNIEITNGLEKNANVVATGAAFLTDGDTVRVVSASEGPQGGKE
jgi:HlyD family secretion protein